MVSNITEIFRVMLCQIRTGTKKFVVADVVVVFDVAAVVNVADVVVVFVAAVVAYASHLQYYVVILVLLVSFSDISEVLPAAVVLLPIFTVV